MSNSWNYVTQKLFQTFIVQKNRLVCQSYTFFNYFGILSRFSMTQTTKFIPFSCQFVTFYCYFCVFFFTLHLWLSVHPDTLGLRTSRDDSSSGRATSKTDLNLVKSNSTSHSPVPPPPAKQNNNQSFSENVAVQNDLQNVVPDKHSTPGSRVPLPIGVADTLLNTELTNTKLINTKIENTKFSNTKLSTTTPPNITSNTKHLDLLGDIINTGTIKTEKTVKQQVPAKVEFNSDSQTPDQVLSGLLNSDEDSNNSDYNETVYRSFHAHFVKWGKAGTRWRDKRENSSKCRIYTLYLFYLFENWR